MNQLEAGLTLGHEVYFQLAARLKELLGQRSDTSVTSFVRDFDCLFDIVD